MKQIIVARKDLNMSPGKLAAQVAHASVSAAILIADENDIVDWFQVGQTKVVLAVHSAQELQALKDRANDADVPCYLVVDEGRTELPSSTPTCLGIGPASEELINKVTGQLALY